MSKELIILVQTMGFLGINPFSSNYIPISLTLSPIQFISASIEEKKKNESV